MLIEFPPIFVADTKIIYGYNIVARLTKDYRVTEIQSMLFLFLEYKLSWLTQNLYKMKNIRIDRLVIGHTLAIIQFCRKLYIMAEELSFVDIMMKVSYEFDPTFNRDLVRVLYNCCLGQ